MRFGEALVHLTLCYINEPPHDKTNKMTVYPAQTQISLGIRPVWSESSLCTQWVAKDPSFLNADSEVSDQTGQMPRLIWVFAGCTCHFVGFVMRWLKFSLAQERKKKCVNSIVRLSDIVTLAWQPPWSSGWKLIFWLLVMTVFSVLHETKSYTWYYKQGVKSSSFWL